MNSLLKADKLLLVLARTVILVSENNEILDHIVLSDGFARLESPKYYLKS
jgi:hypothetical protein